VSEEEEEEVLLLLLLEDVGTVVLTQLNNLGSGETILNIRSKIGR
jgi:hypothetical protein